MDQFRNFGQVCRQHYEKFVLTAALLVLAGAVYFLYVASEAEREKIREIPKGFEGRKVKPVQPAILGAFGIAIKQVESPPALDLSRQHHLFNPVQWQSRGGVIQKIQSNDQIGPGAMVATRIGPLNLVIAYGYASLSGQAPDVTVTGYWMNTTNELVVRGKRVIPSFMTTGTNNMTNVPFFIREIKGDPKEPTEILAEMKEGGEKFSFAPGKPFYRVVGYEADLFYKPAKRTHSGQRKGMTVDMDGQNYKIVDILPNQAVLSDDSNGKQYTIPVVPVVPQ